MKRFCVFLPCIIVLILFIYGCCSSSKDVFVNLNRDSETVYREVVIDENGRMPRVSFPTGTIIEAPEEMTLQPGIKVTLVEQKITADNYGVFAKSNYSAIYIYKVTAVMKSDKPLIPDTVVTTVEKPFSVIVPSEKKEDGTVFVSVKEDDTSPWRFFNPLDSSISSIENTFYQYRLGTQFALLDYNTSFGKLPEVIVSSIIASTPASILVKDGKYLEDLDINAVLKGSNLDYLKPSDFKARITYRNNSEDVANIKVNGELCSQTTKSDKTVPGKSYVHSFTVSNITEASLMSSEGKFGFKISLKDVDTELFSSGFLIEFFNKIEGEKIYPYVYTEFVNIKKTEKADFTIVADNRNILDNSNQIYRCNPSFTVTSDYKFSEGDWAKIASAVRIIKQDPNVIANTRLVIASSTEAATISETTSKKERTSPGLSARASENAEYEYISDGVIKKCQDNKLSITFSKNLDSNSNYIIRMEEPDNIDGVTIVPFDELTFKTAEDIVFSISPSEDSIIDSTKQIYCVDPIFYISANNNFFSDNDWINVANAISITNLDENIASKTVNGDSITLFFTQNLENDKQYTVSMSELNDIDGLNIIPLDPFSFTTQPDATLATLTFTLTSDDSVYDAISQKYRCNPEFIITPNYSLNDENKTAIANAISVSNAEGVTKTWDGDSLKITFSQPLIPDSAHSISMGAVNITGVSISLFEPIDFTTVATLTLALTADDGNVFISTPTELYHCHPAFTITPSFDVNNSDKDIIANAVSINNNAAERMTKTWNGNELKIGFSPDLDCNTNYTISVASINGIDGVPVATPDSVSFTTMNGLTINASSDDSNVFVTLNDVPLYKTLATFTITTNMALSDENKNKIYNAVSVANVDPNKISKIWSSDTTLTLGFKGNLATGTEYSISLAAIQDMNGVSIPASTLYSFRTMDSLSFTATPDEGSIYTAIDQKYHLRPSFTVTPNYTLTDADRTTVLEAVSVSNADNVTKEWEGNELKIAFSSNLAPDSAHSLAISNISSIPGVLVTPFDNLDFTTLATLTFNVVDDADNVYNPPSTQYHCRPAFTITPSFTIKDDDKSKISDAISVTNTGNIISKSWNENTLRIEFNENLATNTAYTLSMAAVQNMDNIIIATFTDKAFNTIINDLYLSFNSNSNNAFSNSKYHCRPSFTITPSFDIRDSDKTAIASAVVITNVDDSIINKTWDGNLLKLNITQNIATNTAYTLSMADITDVKGVNVNSFNPFSFTTMPDLIITIATASLNCEVLKPGDEEVLTVGGKTYCYTKPEFYISTNISISNENLDKISNALTVSGDGASLKTTGSWSPYFQGLQTTLSFSDYLTASTTYTISLSEIAGFEGVPVKAFTPYEFTTFFFKGKGKDTLPFLINTPAQLACLNKISQFGYYYKQMENLNLSSYTNWQPIGSFTAGLRFAGAYDGNNKKISNLVINRPDENYAGLFGAILGSFNNLTLENINVTANNNVGCLSGYSNNAYFNNVTITNSNASGTKYIGTLTGYAGNSIFSNITITDCESHGTEDYVGGLCGFNSNRALSDINASNIDISGRSYVGGISGYSNKANHSNINCNGITLTGSSYLGGAYGYVYENNTFNNCSVANSNITGTGSNIGGFIGYRYYQSATLNTINCNNVNVSGINTVGGCIGYGSLCSFQKCSVIGSEIQGQQDIGGFIGKLSNTSNGITGISKCFVISTTVEGNDLNIGGFAGSTINKYNSLIDSSYVASCTISSANTLADDNYSLSSFVANNSGTISNCYVYGSTVTGKDGYGAIVGVDGDTTTLKDCFVSQDHDKLVGQPGTNCTVTSCYHNVNDSTTFKGTETWSDGNTINGGSSAWSNFDTSSFPPQLTDYPEP